MTRARSVVESSHGIGVDTTDMRWLAQAMRDTSRKASRDFRAGLTAVGEIIATEARAKAAESSTTIAPTIKVRVANTTVEIRAGSDDVPLARLFETGNLRKGRVQPPARDGQTFSHPVYGNTENWVRQPTHPFLRPAAITKQAEAYAMLQKVLRDALKSQGVKT